MRRQFPVLYRLFLARMIDLEILSAGGDVRDIIARSVSLLAGLSLILTYMIAGRYFTIAEPRTRFLYSIWNDEEFLLSTTIAVAGLFAVLAWNAVFPDRRDCLVLGPLPVSTPVIVLAKLAAIGTALGVSLIAMNSFTGLVFPNAVGDSGVAWWITVFAAGIFIFTAMLALQGVAAQFMSWGIFLRVSGFLQLAALFTVIALFFITPPFAASILRPGPPVQWLPSYWFTGLLHRLDGDPDPRFIPLAAVALRNLSIAVAVAALTWGLSYYRNIRRIIQAPDIAPSPRTRLAADCLRFASRQIFARPLDRAIVMFTARSVTRSGQHRLLLAVCGGAGFATALAFSHTFLEGRSTARWDEPNVPFLIAGLLLLFCAIAGMRSTFAIPMNLPANWIFRLTAVHRPAAYFAAVRKALITLGAVPVWLACAVAYFWIWPELPALEHMLVLLLLGLLLIDRSLFQFRKIPFACSWLPGGVQLKMRAGVHILGFLTFAGLAADLELWTMNKPVRFAILLWILLAAVVLACRRAAETAAAPGNCLQFEDLPAAEIVALDLRSDSTWFNDEP